MFVAAGYIANLAMWIPIRRYLFIYSYMPALYFGLLALAGALERVLERIRTTLGTFRTAGAASAMSDSSDWELPGADS